MSIWDCHIFCHYDILTLTPSMKYLSKLSEWQLTTIVMASIIKILTWFLPLICTLFPCGTLRQDWFLNLTSPLLVTWMMQIQDAQRFILCLYFFKWSGIPTPRCTKFSSILDKEVYYINIKKHPKVVYYHHLVMVSSL